MTYPHCDALVIHSPKAGCKYCNMSPELQQERAQMGVNFTGENDSSKLPDPATQQRPLEVINKWSGNVVADETFRNKQVRYFARLRKMLKNIKNGTS